MDQGNNRIAPITIPYALSIFPFSKNFYETFANEHGQPKLASVSASHDPCGKEKASGMPKRRMALCPIWFGL